MQTTLGLSCKEPKEPSVVSTFEPSATCTSGQIELSGCTDEHASEVEVETLVTMEALPESSLVPAEGINNNLTSKNFYYVHIISTFVNAN